MEAQAQDLDKEVDGIAGKIALGPTPVGVFDEESRISGQLDVTGGSLDDLQALFLEQRQQRCNSGGADLFAAPTRCWRVAARHPATMQSIRARGCHSLSSNGVG